MQIYIGNLSPKITSFNLVSLFEGYGKCPSFDFRTYQKDDEQRYYAVTSIEPESLAKDFIDRRNMTRIKDRIIVLREYKSRSVFNERREFGWGSKKWLFDERRKVDRRFVEHDKVVMMV